MEAFENAHDDFLFIDDSDKDDILVFNNTKTWQVLIVDDDPEIHSVTKLALSDIVVLGRRLEYLHAYSGKDACKLIEKHKGIVLLLLDIVMETDDAGLNVVKYIRETLHRKDIRIVLRTGQPGYAPEESIIKAYDINDYKTKTELTRRKLVTTIFAAIRSFQQITTVNDNRLGLEKIVSGVTELSAQHSLSNYSQSVLCQLKNLISSDISAIFFTKDVTTADNIEEVKFHVLAQLGFDNTLINQPLDKLQNSQISNQVTTCYLNEKSLFLDNSFNLYISKGDYCAVTHVNISRPLTSIQIQLLNVFLTGVAVGYENVHLFQKLTHAAYKDWLTDLPNRLEFVHSLDDFAQSESSNNIAALIDINHFSDTNDTLGQNIGNKLLIAVAQRMQSRYFDCQLARIGDDVFGIIGSADSVTPESLIALFHQPFSAGDQQLSINACFGLCTKEQAKCDGVEVLNQINIALNIAKKNRVAQFAYYHGEIEDEMQWRLNMISQLRKDFANNCLELWYQPQLSLSTGKVIGAEALLRWRTTDGNFIPPGVFIPLAEYSGLIIEIGDWVISQACKQIQALDDRFADLSISVNVSIPQFRQDSFVEKTINTINQHKISPSRLELEITESVLMDDPEIIIEALNKLKAQGISIALDDFGTGFSSLNYLQKLPLDRLKIDRSFITDINQEAQSIIVETIINLAKKMRLKVVAEGIEKITQQERLITLGCDEVQGFYYAKPMPADELLHFLYQKN